MTPKPSITQVVSYGLLFINSRPSPKKRPKYSSLAVTTQSVILAFEEHVIYGKYLPHWCCYHVNDSKYPQTPPHLLPNTILIKRHHHQETLLGNSHLFLSSNFCVKTFKWYILENNFIYLLNLNLRKLI